MDAGGGGRGVGGEGRRDVEGGSEASWEDGVRVQENLGRAVEMRGKVG